MRTPSLSLSLSRSLLLLINSPADRRRGLSPPAESRMTRSATAAASAAAAVCAASVVALLAVFAVSSAAAAPTLYDAADIEEVNNGGEEPTPFYADI